MKAGKTGLVKSWIARVSVGGKRRDMGLGSVELVSLADAREKAQDARRLAFEGSDPIESRKAARAARRLEEARAMTFKAAAEKYIEANKAGWKNAKHAAQWTATLSTYAYPVFGDLPIGAVDVALVTKVLEPIWATKSETATRVRGRIECVLDWATARGYRTGENPARWKGHLENLLPKSSKVRQAKHHAALPYGEIGAFMERLRKQEGTSARVLEFAILTAARTGEVIGARWDEIDFGAKLWTIPADRMKSGREHRVPLSAPAIELLRELEKKHEGVFVFTAIKRKSHTTAKPLSNMALLMQLRRMGRDDLTAHGFRSTFRDWAAERTKFPAEVAEMALAHAVSDKVEAAYRRGDLFEKRRALANEWAKFCAKPSARASSDVVPIGKRDAK